jgi:hypothetical protein
LKRTTIVVVLLCWCLVATAGAKDKDSNADSTGFTVGVQAKVSTLGIGADIAVPVLPIANLRAGFGLFSLDRTFTRDGLPYTGTLELRSVSGQFDIFPFGGAFHISPGVLVYNGNNLSANANAAPGTRFTLGGNQFVTPPGSSVTGTGRLDFNKAGPMVTVGFGNLVPRRRSKHFTVSTEFGFAYVGQPKVALNLTGIACNANGSNCRDISNDATFQSSVQQEQSNLQSDASPFRFHPILSFGVGYKF